VPPPHLGSTKLAVRSRPRRSIGGRSALHGLCWIRCSTARDRTPRATLTQPRHTPPSTELRGVLASEAVWLERALPSWPSRRLAPGSGRTSCGTGPAPHIGHHRVVRTWIDATVRYPRNDARPIARQAARPPNDGQAALRRRAARLHRPARVVRPELCLLQPVEVMACWHRRERVACSRMPHVPEV
jgi:hypothetical protein